MHSHNCTELQCFGETVNKNFIVSHDGAFVGHEVLETVNAVFLDQGLHVLFDRVVPPGDRDMKRIVSHGFLRPLAPLLVGLQDVLLWIRNNEIDDHRRPAGKACCRARVKVFAGNRAHEGELHMGMRVDSARHDILTAGVDYFCTLMPSQVRSDFLDLAVGAEHIGTKRLLRSNNSSTFD